VVPQALGMEVIMKPAVVNIKKRTKNDLYLTEDVEA